LNSELGLYWISRLFQKLLDRIWLVEYIETHGTFSDLEDIYTLFNKIKEYNEKNPDLSLKELLEKFDLYKKYNIAIARQILKKTSSNIEILTAHASKWLEYDYVYIPGVYSGNWESKRVTDKLKLPIWIAWNWLQFAWLSEKEQKDLEKNEFLKSRNIEVLRVRCSPLTKITENDLIVENDDWSKSDLNRVFKKIYSFGDTAIKEKINEYLDSDHFLNENLFREYLSYFPSPLPENSLTTKFPNLISEWDCDKNHPLIPDQFYGRSGKKV